MSIRLVGGTILAPGSNRIDYTVRIQTANARRASSTDPFAGVQLCLVGETGQSLIHRVSAWDGGDRRRFQAGQVDEVHISGQDIGAITGVYVGPEAGSWMPGDIEVAPDGGAHQNFKCSQLLGEHGEAAAAYLSAIPEGYVMYGQGDTATLVTEAEASALRAAGMDAYGRLKTGLLASTSAVAAAGTIVTAAVGGVGAAQTFAFGGLVAVAYQYALQQSVDRVGAGEAAGSKDAARGRASRIALVALFAVIGVQLTADAGPEVGHVLLLREVLTAVAGFMSYKVAVVLTAMTSED